MEFYGHHQTQKRLESWRLLRRLHEQCSLPWLCAGDFNEILADDEKYGGAICPARQITYFKEAIRECCLFDMNFSRAKYTWLRRYGSDLIAERLDRGLANEAFQKKFVYS